MCYDGVTLFAAALRGVGIDAQVCPEAAAGAWEQALRQTSGDECYPQRVVLADFLQGMEDAGVPPVRAALFITIGGGPCRFGQYAPFLDRALTRMGLPEVLVLCPNSDNGYREVQEHGSALQRMLWWAVVASDALRRLLYQTRPYELQPGAADRAYEECLADVSRALEGGGSSLKARRERVESALAESRRRLLAVPVCGREDRPLIGVVGEIFCRLNRYSNDDVIRKIEKLGGEAWLSGVAEWVWYANASELQTLALSGQTFTRKMLSAKITWAVQRKDEERLMTPFRGDFVGREEPHDVHEILELARPYLPWEGALGEMVMSVGKAVYLQRMGADGVIDVSPFGCMNGIVSEAVYPKLSRENGGIPIRNFYVDRATSRLEDGLEIFLELARNYRARRTRAGAESCRAGAL